MSVHPHVTLNEHLWLGWVVGVVCKSLMTGQKVWVFFYYITTEMV
jgi:hypothetical protein